MSEFRANKKYKIILFSSLVICLISLIFQMYISNSTAVKGMEFKKLYESKKQLEKEIAYLQYENSNYSSLTYIEKKAKELGFINMTDSIATIMPPSLASASAQ